MNLSLVKAILRAPWLIDEEYAMMQGPLVMRILSGERAYEDDDRNETGEFDPIKQKNASYVISKNITAGRWTSMNDANIPAGSTAIIPVRNEIMKYDADCGGARGTLSIERDIKDADTNPNISGIVLVFDSPGGEVTHTDLISQTIADTKTPIVAYVEGMACSAAYWMASATDRIIASSKQDRVGSIGTMCYFGDYTGYWEKMGIKVHEFYATKSTEKNKDFNEAVKGNYEPYRTKVLDKLNANFHAFVKAQRPDLDEKVLKGASYFADEAIELGLVDEIGSFDYAVQVATSLGSTSETANEKTTDTMKLNKTLSAMLNFFGIAADKAEETDLTPEMVESLNNSLAEKDQMIADLQQKADKAAELEIQLQSEKDAHAKTRNDFEEFKASDAGVETTTFKKKDEIEGEADESGKLAHNQLADEFL